MNYPSDDTSLISDGTLALRIECAETELTFAQAEFTKVSDARNKVARKLTELREEQCRRTLKNGDDISLILQAFPENKVGYQRYTDLMREYGLHSGGYWTVTNQRIVGVMFKKQDCAENVKQVEGLLMLAPYVLPIEKVTREDDAILVGCKPFDILEHTLSEGGVYHFYLRPNNTVILSFTRYHRTTYTEIGDFNAAMKYIQHHHWYESDDADDNRYDYDYD